MAVSIGNITRFLQPTDVESGLGEGTQVSKHGKTQSQPLFYLIEHRSEILSVSGSASNNSRRKAIRQLLAQNLIVSRLPAITVPICTALVSLRPHLAGRLFKLESEGPAATIQQEYHDSNGAASFKYRLDACFQRGDIAQATAAIWDHFDQNLPEQARPKRPTKANQWAAKFVLSHPPRLAHPINATQEEIQALQFQAAELLLCGRVVVDRSEALSRALHPKGNEWLLGKYSSHALARAKKQLEAASHTRPSRSDMSRRRKASNSLHPGYDDIDTTLPKVRVPVRLKITLPYAFLALVFALAGAYLISQVVFESLEERFTNQLIEVGKLAADRMVLEEDARLETLRLLANTDGLAEALVVGDAERLREIALPIAVNAQEEAIELINLEGVSVLSLRQRTGFGEEQYLSTRGDSDYQAWDFIQQILQGVDDSGRDKHANVVRAPWGDYLYVAGPVYGEDEAPVGIVLVGKTLPTLAHQFREQTLAQTTFYALDGSPIFSTFLANGDADLRLDANQVQNIRENQEAGSLSRSLSILSIEYSEIVGPWTVRADTNIGMIGSSLAQTFLASPSDTTRLQIFVLVAVGLIVIVAIGTYISRKISQPLLQIVTASAQVAQGNLDVSVEPVGNDEVAVLAHSFNHMMEGLREATARKLHEIELMQDLEHERELRELKSRFVSMVSHEFRTPLATILSSSEYIKTYGEVAPYAKRQKHFGRIQGAVSNMTRLLEDVLIIGRNDSGRLEFNPTIIDVDEFCREIVDEMQTSAGTRHAIKYAQRGNNRRLLLDANLLRVALTNLLSNAIKYSPDGGRIDFNLVCDEKKLMFRVRDSGIGIPQEDQQRLFETFHRASNVSNIAGTGLGLYITKMAVELHDGQIKFESQQNVGTTFTITMPARVVAEEVS